MRAASHAKTLDAAKATSRVFSIRKCQVTVPPRFGREDGSAISATERIGTVVSLVRAFTSRAIWTGVSTAAGFISAPDPATSMSLGTVTQ